VDLLIGDPTKMKEKLGWVPKVGFKELVRIMTDADLEIARRELAMRDALGGASGQTGAPA
jgi:GDPmannose 4,6-dehydratase